MYKMFGCLFVWIISTKVNKDELKNVPLKGLFCRVKKSSIKTGKYVKCNSNWISSFSLRIDRPAWYCLKIGNPSKLLTSEIMIIFRDGEKIGEWYEGTVTEVNAQKGKSIKVNILRISLFYVYGTVPRSLSGSHWSKSSVGWDIKNKSVFHCIHFV